MIKLEIDRTNENQGVLLVKNGNYEWVLTGEHLLNAICLYFITKKEMEEDNGEN